jgi:hypothetical protein
LVQRTTTKAAAWEHSKPMVNKLEVSLDAHNGLHEIIFPQRVHRALLSAIGSLAQALDLTLALSLTMRKNTTKITMQST